MIFQAPMAGSQDHALAIAVADAHADVIAAADWVTTRKGGRGAVREVCDLLLRARQAPGSA